MVGVGGSNPLGRTKLSFYVGLLLSQQPLDGYLNLLSL
jgi:hypothetical protein